VNYARRQQYRRLSRAGAAASGSAAAGILALLVASVGALSLAGLLLLTAAGLALSARHWLSLAGRSRVGARSEDEVRRALAPLEVEGWRLRHSLRWQGRGDIDSVAIAPTGVAVAIETKTRSYDADHLARVYEQAAWLSRRRRRWCRRGSMAVLCLASGRGVQRVEDDVLVVSIDRLVSALRDAVGCPCAVPHPASRSRAPRARRARCSSDTDPSSCEPAKLIARVRAWPASPVDASHRHARIPSEAGAWPNQWLRPVAAVNSRAVQVPAVESKRRSPPRRACQGRLAGT
jgi:Nuclease-related domain